MSAPTFEFPEPQKCFPGIRGGAAEQIARDWLALTTHAAYSEADAVTIDINELALLCIAVLSVGNSARPEGVAS